MMTDGVTMTWTGLLLLGAFHGVNPGMGWLFAVALGMQEKRRRAVWRAMLPLGVGHGLAIVAALLVAAALGRMLPLEVLRWMVAGVLLTLGIYRLFRHRHPRWVGMKVDMKDLTVWSFLMATAHGAGLMVLPLFLGIAAHQAGGHAHHAMQAANSGVMTGLMVTLVHGAGYLVVTALAAAVVFEKLGVGLLRKAWFNLDVVWAATLIATAGLTLAF
ncbi:MAG TPA: hypothetical protein VLE48_02725 [Terriglobales bacterium]|nr:hypothetical protein [Terriglobales bacterium]